MSQPSESDAPVALQSVLITGGGSGIGAALADELASRRCQVLISGRRSAPLRTVAESSDRISISVGDITDPSHRDALSVALGDLPGPRGIVHAAGYFQNGLLDKLSVGDWHASFATNVEARWALSAGCASVLDDGRILFIGSDAGSNPRAGGAAYSIAQAASETLRRALQVEWANGSIAVGGFKPGLVDTDMVRGFMRLSPEEFPARSAYLKYLNDGQIAPPSTIAQFASWLLLDVDAQRFHDTEWDIRHEEHHTEWLDGPLYPTSGVPGSASS